MLGRLEPFHAAVVSWLRERFGERFWRNSGVQKSMVVRRKTPGLERPTLEARMKTLGIARPC